MYFTRHYILVIKAFYNIVCIIIYIFTFNKSLKLIFMFLSINKNTKIRHTLTHLFNIFIFLVEIKSLGGFSLSIGSYLNGKKKLVVRLWQGKTHMVWPYCSHFLSKSTQLFNLELSVQISRNESLSKNCNHLHWLSVSFPLNSA